MNLLCRLGLHKWVHGYQDPEHECYIQYCPWCHDHQYCIRCQSVGRANGKVWGLITPSLVEQELNGGKR